MHKLKNKHTGEVIATPYLAEVEEYLNSGDYEMTKKYPRILKSKSTQDDRVMLAFNKNECQCINSEQMSTYCGFDFDVSENWLDVTREHLANTYGKCDSKKHADFICELAVKNGFAIKRKYDITKKFFNFCGDNLDFWVNENAAKSGFARLIYLPLPPKKESKMPKEKPVYTKEMQERGEKPPIGSEILAIRKGYSVKCEVLKVRFNGHFDVAALMALEDGDSTEKYQLFYCALVDVKAIQTIEGELFGVTARFIGGEITQADLVCELLEKYNITPKEK